MTTQPDKYIADQARSAWQRSHAGSLIDRIFRLLGAATVAEVIYIAEYASGDWDTAHCTGDPVHVWAYCGEEFQEIEALGELDLKNPIASRTPVICYCLATDGQRMIHTTWNGPRAGYGHILRRVEDEWKSEGGSWRS